VIKALNRRDPDHNRAYQLYRQLVEGAVVCAVCWPVLRLEFWYAWDRAVGDLSAEALGALAREVREVVTGQGELALEEPEPATDEEKRSYRLGEGEQLLGLLLTTFRVVRVRLTEQLLGDARMTIVSSGLKPLDAMVCAVARTLSEATGGPPSIVSFDKDFRRARGFHVWGLR